MAEPERAIRAILRREERGYFVEVDGPAGQTRTRHATLIEALNAHPTLRQLWLSGTDIRRGAWLGLVG